MGRVAKPVAVGERFGRLTVVGLGDRNSKGDIRWECRCDCGSVTQCRPSHLYGGRSQSCGCFRGDLGRAKLTTHGRTSTSLFTTWKGMLRRCDYPKHNRYHLYGGRGIKVCTRWLRFENFAADMGEKPTPKHSLDRINVDGDYEPGNVRWATPTDQARNTRRSKAKRTREAISKLTKGLNMTPEIRTELLKLRKDGTSALKGIANTMIAQIDAKQPDDEMRAQFIKNARRLQIAHQAPATYAVMSPADIAAALALGQVLDLQ